MEFGAFLGNDALKARLQAAAAQERLSHSYLLCGPAGSGKHTLARLLAAAMQCTAARRPCLQCSACRKVLAGTHPDVITVDDETHKNLPVELIRRTRADVFVRPNEGRRKVYIIPRAQDLGPASQNALLKIMEEPPPYAAFLLLSVHAELLLPTIRSRSVLLHLSPLPGPLLLQALRDRVPGKTEEDYRAAAAQSGGFLGQALEALSAGQAFSERAEAFAAAYARRDRLALTELLVPMEKLGRDALCEELTQWIALLHGALRARAHLAAASPLCRQISAGRTGEEILRAVDALQQALRYAQSNVGPGHICGALQVRLR